MSKSIIIIISAIWVFCTLYFSFAKTYNYPYAVPAMAGAWISSVLLLICIIKFIVGRRQH